MKYVTQTWVEILHGLRSVKCQKQINGLRAMKYVTKHGMRKYIK